MRDEGRDIEIERGVEIRHEFQRRVDVDFLTGEYPPDVLHQAAFEPFQFKWIPDTQENDCKIRGHVGGSDRQ